MHARQPKVSDLQEAQRRGAFREARLRDRCQRMAGKGDWSSSHLSLSLRAAVHQEISPPRKDLLAAAECCDRSEGISMETGFRLLMDDGAVQIVFHPRLTVEQYAELLRIADRATTKDELRDALELSARLWEKDVEFDDQVI